VTKKYADRKSNKKESEVVLIIDCKKEMADMVKNALWSNYALGLRVLSLNINE
jgi:hypothetical protein